MVCTANDLIPPRRVTEDDNAEQWIPQSERCVTWSLDDGENDPVRLKATLSLLANVDKEIGRHVCTLANSCSHLLKRSDCPI
jgi:hypothetical protein